jgi:hypothetical protein
MRDLMIVTIVAMLTSAAGAGTIIKLDLDGGSAHDIQFDGTTLKTIDDGDAGTFGDQNTDANFQDFLDSFPDVLTPIASFNLRGLAPTVPPGARLVDSLVVQYFSGGIFQLYDPANTLLLSVSLHQSVLVGGIDGTATGALFTTSLSSVTGGQFAGQFDPPIGTHSLKLSLSFADINGGIGLHVSGAGAQQTLNPFTANATLLISGEQIPEPTMAALMSIGAILASLVMPRRRD